MQSYNMEEVFRAIVCNPASERASENKEKVTKKVRSKKFKMTKVCNNENGFNIEQVKNEVYAKTYSTFSLINC